MPRLEPMLVRVPPEHAEQLRELSRRTRVRQAEYVREAIAALLAKYAASPVPTFGSEDQ